MFIRKINRQKLKFLALAGTFQGVSTGSRDQNLKNNFWPKFYQINFRKIHKISIRCKMLFRS